MKLSEKGVNKILKGSVIQTPDGESYLILNDLSKIEFEPEDFKDTVVLTVEEAQAIRSKLCDLLLFAKGKDHYQSNVKKDLSLLWGRIIQAENK